MYCIKRKKILSLVLLLFSIVFVILGLVVRLKNAQSPHADFRLLNEEQQVVKATHYTEASNSETSINSGTITHGGIATYYKDLNKLNFMFENTSSEENDIVISLIYENVTIWQSGLICSGKGLAPNIDVNIELDTGVYNCTLVVNNYNHVSGEKSILSLTADVELVVTDSSDTTVFQ